MAFTAAQIVAYALQIAKAPGFTVQGGMSLNLALQDLSLHRNLKVNRVTESLTFTPGTYGPFPLAANYLRTYDLIYRINGLAYPMMQVSNTTFDDEFLDPSISNYPYEFSTDLFPQTSGLPANMYIYPQTSGVLAVTHRYMLQQPDINMPETSATVPWFSDTDYLIQATAARVMRITDDARYGEFALMCEVMLKRHLLTEGDEASVVISVGLDPRRFSSNRSLKPTKVTN